MSSKSVKAEDLKHIARNRAAKFLDDPNITSVGVAYKQINGKPTKQLSIQFTVGRKLAPESLENEGIKPLPQTFTVDGVEVPTDIVERDFGVSGATSSASANHSSRRKARMDPIRPGVSIGHPRISAGTAGCLVFGANDSQQYMLSNWHVLQGAYGDIGDDIVQPGKHDDNRIEQNVAGKLVRSHLGVAGDCAIAKIDLRMVNPQILDIDVTVTEIGEPKLGDKVVKSGRTTGVTYGIVSRIYVTVNLNYGAAGTHKIGGFEYVPDPANPPVDGEVSKGGDSGSAVMMVKSGKATGKLLGIHFAGEVGSAPEHGLACYSTSVFEKLQLSAQAPQNVRTRGLHGAGFDWYFLGEKCASPMPIDNVVKGELLTHNQETVFDYTHFSLVMNKKRKFASWVAWNIDGGSIKRVSRSGIPFIKDPELPSNAQIGNELYVNNPLDRGHIARRADLCWGNMYEAKKANKDSFFYTNMVPQHARFNQSSQRGIWGSLEDAIFAEAKIKDLRLSVFGGPIFDSSDQVYRNTKIPKDYWKVICYIDEETSVKTHHAYVLTQRNLIHDLEALDLDEFAIYQAPLSYISERIGFSFGDLSENNPEVIESEFRKVTSLSEVLKP